MITGIAYVEIKSFQDRTGIYTLHVEFTPKYQYGGIHATFIGSSETGDLEECKRRLWGGTHIDFGIDRTRSEAIRYCSPATKLETNCSDAIWIFGHKAVDGPRTKRANCASYVVGASRSMNRCIAKLGFGSTLFEARRDALAKCRGAASDAQCTSDLDYIGSSDCPDYPYYGNYTGEDYYPGG